MIQTVFEMLSPFRLSGLLIAGGFLFFFSVKGKTVNILGLVGLSQSAESTQLCCCSLKAAIDSM